MQDVIVLNTCPEDSCNDMEYCLKRRLEEFFEIIRRKLLDYLH